MPLDCELPDDDRRDLILLSLIYRLRHSRGSRRRQERILGSTIDSETGVERQEADLLPEWQAVRGPELVFGWPVQPEELAQETLLRNEVDGSKPSLGFVQALGVVVDLPDVEHPGVTHEGVVMHCPLHERGRAEEEVVHLEKEHPEWKPRIRVLQGSDAWTEEEAEAISEMTYRWQRTMIAWAEKGWLRLEPPLRFEPVGTGEDPGRGDLYVRGTDDRGLPHVGTITPEGLEEAERRIVGDPRWSQGAFSSVVAMPGDLRAKVATRNPWAAQRALQEDGQGVA